MVCLLSVLLVGQVFNLSGQVENLSHKTDLQAQAEKLNGKTGIVTGTLAIRKGVEIRQRFIVTVTTLKAAE